MKKIITLGEIMLRLSTPGQQRFAQAQSFDVHYGGGEANVAVSLAAFGNETAFLTCLPPGEIGDAALAALRARGVETSGIVRSGRRLGIYFLETGAAMRPSKVVYDRAHSAISEVEVEAFDLDALMAGADWFHWTGITPALSPQAARLVEAACRAARRQGLTVSCDLNFRKKLWTPAQAQRIMRPLMAYVDVCIGNEEDAELSLGFRPTANVEAGQTDAAGYRGIFEEMARTFGFRYVASTLRESFSASHNGWKAMIYDGATFYASRRYDIQPIVDRVGGGDAFAAGLIHGLVNGMTQADALEFAVAASALKHTIPGDFNAVTTDEVLALARGEVSGRVQR